MADTPESTPMKGTMALLSPLIHTTGDGAKLIRSGAVRNLDVINRRLAEPAAKRAHTALATTKTTTTTAAASASSSDTRHRQQAQETAAATAKARQSPARVLSFESGNAE